MRLPIPGHHPGLGFRGIGGVGGGAGGAGGGVIQRAVAVVDGGLGGAAGGSVGGGGCGCRAGGWHNLPIGGQNGGRRAGGHIRIGTAAAGQQGGTQAQDSHNSDQFFHGKVHPFKVSLCAKLGHRSINALP